METILSYSISYSIVGNEISIVDIFLIIDCLLLVGFILIQNESSNSTFGIQSNFSNPVEDWTSLFLGFLFCLFLLKIKISS